MVRVRCRTLAWHPTEYRERVLRSSVRSTQFRGQRFSTASPHLLSAAVEAHGGHIGVDSEVGRGSTFWFVLPRNGPTPK